MHSLNTGGAVQDVNVFGALRDINSLWLLQSPQTSP